MQKAVGGLITKTFFVPFFQRGYRWETEQVETLLKDLWEFHRKLKKKEKGYKYYFLQPLIVKKEQKRYRVIDGQQRLTTIAIILSAIKEILGEQEDNLKISYERKGSKEFLKKISNNAKGGNIDLCYMRNAYKTVCGWIKDENISKSNLKQFRDFILRDSDNDPKTEKDLNENIRFLWYELEETQDEFDVFIRLNIGKIPLANAELIKSFIFQKAKSEKKKLEISSEWNEIEYYFEDNEFFGFLTKENLSTRTELLFQILLNLSDYKGYYE